MEDGGHSGLGLSVAVWSSKGNSCDSGCGAAASETCSKPEIAVQKRLKGNVFSLESEQGVELSEEYDVGCRT